MQCLSIYEMKEEIWAFSKLFSFLFYHIKQKSYVRSSKNGVPLNCGPSQAARPVYLDRELCGLCYKIALDICTKERCLDAAAGGGLAISIGKQYF